MEGSWLAVEGFPSQLAEANGNVEASRQDRAEMARHADKLHKPVRSRHLELAELRRVGSGHAIGGLSTKPGRVEDLDRVHSESRSLKVVLQQSAIRETRIEELEQTLADAMAENRRLRRDVQSTARNVERLTAERDAARAKADDAARSERTAAAIDAAVATGDLTKKAFAHAREAAVATREVERLEV